MDAELSNTNIVNGMVMLFMVYFNYQWFFVEFGTDPDKGLNLGIV